MTTQHPTEGHNNQLGNQTNSALNNQKALMMTARPLDGKHRGKVAALVSSPITHPITGKQAGFYLGELCHAKFIFCEAGYEVDIYSTEGGNVVWDEHSDPNTGEMGSHDLLSAGFLSRELFKTKLKNTKPLTSLNPDDYVAIWMAGGQAPSITFRNNPVLEKVLAKFHEQGKGIGAVCHGTAALLSARDSSGNFIIKGKKWTGFTDEEEKALEKKTGTKNQPYWIESEARKIPDTHFFAGEPFQQHAIRDGSLVTAQQQNSALLGAQLLMEAIHASQVKFLGDAK